MRIRVTQYKNDFLASMLELSRVFWFLSFGAFPIALGSIDELVRSEAASSYEIWMCIGSVSWLLLIILGRYYMIRKGYWDVCFVTRFILWLIEKIQEKVHQDKPQEKDISVKATTTSAATISSGTGSQQNNMRTREDDPAEHDFWLRVLVEAASDMEIARQLMTPTSANTRERLQNARNQLYSFCQNNCLEDCNIEVQSLQHYVDYSNSSMSPKVKRAFLLLEDSEWERANKYLEEVLDKDPTDAYAYIGKIMIEKQIPTIEELEASFPIERDDKNYQKAIRFASKDLSKKLKQLNGDYDSAQDNNPVSPQKYPLQTVKGTIWVTPSVAEIIVKGKTKRQYELDPDESKALIDFALSLLYDKR